MNDPLFTTLRKDNAVYNLQKNITIPAGNDMTYVDITDNGKVVVATSTKDNQTFVFNGTEYSDCQDRSRCYSKRCKDIP